MDLKTRIERLEQLIKKPPSDDPADWFDLTHSEIAAMWRWDTYGAPLPPELLKKLADNRGKHARMVPDAPISKENKGEDISTKEAQTT